MPYGKLLTCPTCDNLGSKFGHRYRGRPRRRLKDELDTFDESWTTVSPDGKMGKKSLCLSIA